MYWKNASFKLERKNPKGNWRLERVLNFLEVLTMENKILIFENPEDFLQAIEELQQAYTDNNEEV